MTKRFEDLYYCNSIKDNVTGEEYNEYDFISGKVTDLLNQLSDRGDKILEAYTTEELLKLRIEKNIYEKFTNETIKILNKYDIESLAKLDQMLFNQRVW